MNREKPLAQEQPGMAAGSQKGVREPVPPRHQRRNNNNPSRPGRRLNGEEPSVKMATGMAAASYRDRRGPVPPNRHGRNSYNPSRQGMRRSANTHPHHHQMPMQQNQGQQQASQQQLEDFLSTLSSEKSVYKDDRCVRAIINMVGHVVQLTTMNNAQIEGVLSSVSPQMDVELKEARFLLQPDGTEGSRQRIETTFVRASDIMVCSCPNVDISSAKPSPRQFQTDTAISGTNNGAEVDEGGMKALVEWNPGSDASDMTLESSDCSGWPADAMFRMNEEKFNVQTSYKENMDMYTVPIPTFSSEEAKKEAESLAAKKAREIESSEGYRKRVNLENNSDVDEETRHSAVIRNPEPSSSQAYIPPARRQQQAGHNAPLAPRGSAPVIPSHQPLPQRNRDRERADRNHHDQRGGPESDRMSRNLPPRNAPAPPRSQGSSAPAQPSREATERSSAERRSEGSGRGYLPRLDHQGSPAPNQSVGQSVAAAPVNQEANHQPSQAQCMAPNHHANYNHMPSTSVGPPVPASVAPPGPPTQMPPNSLPSLMHMHAGRTNPQAPVISPPVVASQQTVKNSSQAESRESGSLPSTFPNQQQQAVATTSSLTSTEKMSPREKDRQEKQIHQLKEFQSNFRLQEGNEPRPAPLSRPQEKPAESEVKGQSSPVTVAVSSPPRGSSSTTPVSTEGAAMQSPSASQGASVNDNVKTSTLNPNAMEFKPRQQQPQQQQQQQQPPHPAAAMQQIASPAPSGTPPSQGPRQSPSMMHPAALMAGYNQPFMQAKMMNMTAANQGQQQKGYQHQHPKRAVVSVDPVALAATGQPLQLGAQAATMQQPNYVGHVYVPQSMYHTMPMRVMQTLPQGAGMDPNLGTGQQPHPGVPQQFIMTQQPMPAHMPAAQNLPQPAHTVQHLSQHPIQSNMPPASQSNVNPHPSASPVQHLGGNGPPQMNHSQGAPPTSSTPQSGMFGHGMSGIMPPQGAAGHGMPTQTVAQGPAPALQFLHPSAQPQLPGAVSFTQTGGTGGTGPTPAHVQQAGHVNQTHHLVMMPHPPAQAINQAPMNNPTHHQHQQHSAAAAQFQQQLQGATTQLHGGVGPNHLLPGNVPTAGNSMGIHPPLQHYVPQGVQGSHAHHHLGHSQGGHSHSHGHGHSHSHSHQHFQGP